MTEEYKDYCFLKAFDVTPEEVKQCLDDIKDNSIIIDISQDCKDFTIKVINKTSSEISFNNELNRVLEILKDKVYSDDNESLAKVVIKNAKEKAIKISTAESITGGMISSTLVSVPGSSSVFYEGFVTYSSMAKVRRLHVNSSIIETYGVVSEPVCRQMVKGLLANKDVQIAVATTGCAGPDSDEFNTPVGKVYIGTGNLDDIEVFELYLDGNREQIRKTVTNIALYKILKIIEKI